MSLEHYSILVAVSLFALTGLMLVCVALYAFLPAFRRHVHNHSYLALYGAMAAIVLVAIGGALVYQLAYLTPVCELCWWQRIFLFPIAVIALVAAWYRIREAHHGGYPSGLRPVLRRLPLLLSLPRTRPRQCACASVFVRRSSTCVYRFPDTHIRIHNDSVHGYPRIR